MHAVKPIYKLSTVSFPNCHIHTFFSKRNCNVLTFRLNPRHIEELLTLTRSPTKREDLGRKYTDWNFAAVELRLWSKPYTNCQQQLFRTVLFIHFSADGIPRLRNSSPCIFGLSLRAWTAILLRYVAPQ